MNSQTTNKNFTLSVSVGNFTVGHGYIYGIWTGVEGAKSLVSNQKKFINKIKIGGELYFENSADTATVVNPTLEEFIGDRQYHESNTGFAAKIIYYPFSGFIKGLHFAAGPLVVYSIRSYEKRVELRQYSPTLSVRLSEMGYDNRLLLGYRLTLGYEVYPAKHWLVGARADFLQYQTRDLNSLLAFKAGYRF